MNWLRDPVAVGWAVLLAASVAALPSLYLIAWAV